MNDMPDVAFESVCLFNINPAKVYVRSQQLEEKSVNYVRNYQSRHQNDAIDGRTTSFLIMNSFHILFFCFSC